MAKCQDVAGCDDKGWLQTKAECRREVQHHCELLPWLHSPQLLYVCLCYCFGLDPKVSENLFPRKVWCGDLVRLKLTSSGSLTSYLKPISADNRTMITSSKWHIIGCTRWVSLPLIYTHTRTHTRSNTCTQTPWACQSAYYESTQDFIRKARWQMRRLIDTKCFPPDGRPGWLKEKLRLQHHRGQHIVNAHPIGRIDAFHWVWWHSGRCSNGSRWNFFWISIHGLKPY